MKEMKAILCAVTTVCLIIFHCLIAVYVHAASSPLPISFCQSVVSLSCTLIVEFTEQRNLYSSSCTMPNTLGLWPVNNSSTNYCNKPR